jgi:hypothetical protein
MASNKVEEREALNREICNHIYDSLIKLDKHGMDKISYITKKYDLTLKKEETGDIDNIHVLISPRWGMSK